MAPAGTMPAGPARLPQLRDRWPNRTSSVRTILDLAVERRAEIVTIEVEADGFLYNMVRSIAGTLVLVGSRQTPRGVGRRGPGGRESRRGRADRARRRACSWWSVRYRADAMPAELTMRIVHVITRLILGGAQENTLLTVEGLHHRYRRRRDADHRPGRRARGRPLRPRRRAGAESRGDARAGPADPARGRPGRPTGSCARRSDGCRPEVVHTHSSKAGILGRAAAWDERVPAIVHTIHGLPFGPFETPLKNRLYIALERWAARRCHAIVSVCDAMTTQALAAGVGRPEQFLDRLQRHGRGRVPEPAAAARGGPSRAGAGRRRGRLRHGRPALRAEGARRHPRDRRRGPRGEPQGPVRLDRRRHPAATA